MAKKQKWTFTYILKEALTLFVMLIIMTNVVSYFRAPSLESETLPPFLAKEYAGKALMVHFWATWCPVCKTEAPNIETLSQTHNVLTIATQSGDDWEVQNYLKERELSFNVKNDEDGSLAQQFKVTVYPTTFIYNTKGELVFSEVGYTSTLGLKLRMWWANR